MNTPKGLFYERGKRLNFLGGQKARDWRRDAARFSTRPGDYLRTLKFKLQPEQPIRFEDAAKLYEITEGIAPGSLYHLLMTVHLNGFRLFQKKAGATLFKASMSFPEEEFRESLTAQANADPGGLTISALFDKFGGGAPKPYTAEKLTTDLIRMVVGAKSKEPLAESPLKALLQTFAAEVLNRFPSWPKKQELPELFQLFDTSASKLGLKLPALASHIGVLVSEGGDGPQIAYDPCLMTLGDACDDNELIHLACAQKLQMLRQSREEDPAGKLKVEIVSFNANALSWLFGVGLKWLRDSPIEDIAGVMALPESAYSHATALKDAALAVPPDPLFGASGFSNFRKSVEGKITSWISNYLSRLKLLREILEAADLSPSSMPAWTTEPAAEEALERFGFSPSKVNELMAALKSGQARTLDALDRLEGHADRLPDGEDIKAIEGFSARIDGISGVLRQVAKELEDVDTKRRALPSWARPLPRLPRISGGLPNLELEVAEMQASFVDNLKKYREFTEKLLGAAEDHGRLEDPLLKLALSLAASKRDSEPQTANLLQAKRMLLQRLTNVATKGTDNTKQLIAERLTPLFVDPKDCRKRVFNRQGSLFRHPRSTSRHQPFPMHDDRIMDFDIEGLVRGVLENLSGLHDERLIRDKVALEQFLNSIRLNGLPDEIPGSWLSLKEIDEDLGLPSNLAAYADLAAAPRAAVQRAINLYATSAMAAFSRLTRERFFVRTKFMRIEKNTLHWVPKQKTWKPAEHTLTEGNPLGDALANGLIPHTEDGYEVWGGLEALAKNTDGQATLSPRERLTLLQQSPHDWYVDLGLAGLGPSGRKGISVSKKGIGIKAETLQAPARLVGPSSSKQWLLRAMENRELVASGEYMLLIAQHYGQKVEWSNETPQITITPQEVALELALPITDKRPGTELAHHPFSQAVIGIDLGEAGIGYAAFSAAELLARDIQEEGMPAPIASGSIPIPSVRRLIKAVKRFRGTTQRTQHFREGNNTALQKLRDNVVGDVLATIDTLCARLRGFPVLESSVVNLSSGAKQLALVYDRVVHSYCYSDIDAHKAAREHHWAAANNWDHPYLERTKKVQRKDGTWVPGKHEKLKLFPGVSVHPAGTSQRCHKCGRNALQDVRDTYGEGSRNLVSVKEGGIVSCGQGNLVLRTDAPEAEQRASRNTKRLPIGGRSFTEQSELARARGKDNRRRKERSLRTHPMIPQNISADRLRQLVRSQLRQGQASLRSRDTTQSQFFCPYEGCHYVGHADENASINIVWKWWTEGDVRSKTIGGQ